MLCGKRDDLEKAGESGTFFSIWLNAEDVHGSYVDPYEFIDNRIIGDAYDNIEEAKDAIYFEFRHAGIFEQFLEENPEVDWIEAFLECNDLEDGIDRGDFELIYSLMYTRSYGWKEY